MGNVYREPIVKAANVHLYTYAKVMEIVSNEGLTAIESLRTRTIDGKEHRVRARHYVIACGAIHTARLLLASNRRATQGLGNAGSAVYPTGGAVNPTLTVVAMALRLSDHLKRSAPG